MKYVVGLLIVSVSMLSFGFAQEDLSFSDYMKNMTNLVVYTKRISKVSLLNKFILLRDEKCNYQNDGNNYIVSPICLLRKEFPDMPYKTLINKVRDDIDGFNQVYNDASPKFTYKSTNPFFEGYKSIMPQSDRQKYLLAILQEQGINIIIPMKYVYYEKAKELGFFVVRKDLSLLKPCTKQNYKVALNSFDNFVLSSGNIININEHLSYLPGYCKGTGPKNLMFYGGVCGFASQLFRSSLINPDIEILKRSGHSIWLTAYYSNYIYGDDAAIYQNSKQFEIKNNSDQEIYFKVMDKGDFNYLVAITDQKPSEGVNITKMQIEDLSAQVIKEIYDVSSGKIKNTQVFDSSYNSRNSAVR